MIPNTPAPRWSARVDRSDWQALTASAAARGVRVEDLIADMLVELSPADLSTSDPKEEVFVRAALPEHARVEIRERAYLARASRRRHPRPGRASAVGGMRTRVTCPPLMPASSGRPTPTGEPPVGVFLCLRTPPPRCWHVDKKSAL